MLVYIGRLLFILFVCSTGFSSFSYAGPQSLMGADIMGAITVDVEVELNISFEEKVQGDYPVRGEGALSVGGIQSNPALIRVTGATVEVMIDVEKNKIQGYDEGRNEVVSIFDFNISNGDVGTSVAIMPFSEEDSFSFSVGGVVTRSDALNNFYTGANVLNINYL